MIPVYGTYANYVATMKSLDRAVAFSESQITAFVSSAQARGISMGDIEAFISDNPGDFGRIEIALAGPREAITSGTTYQAPTTPQGGTLGGQITYVADPTPRTPERVIQGAIQAETQGSTSAPAPQTSGPPSPLGYSTYNEEGGLHLPAYGGVARAPASVAELSSAGMPASSGGFDLTTILIVGAGLVALWFVFRK